MEGDPRQRRGDRAPHPGPLPRHRRHQPVRHRPRALRHGDAQCDQREDAQGGEPGRRADRSDLLLPGHRRVGLPLPQAEPGDDGRDRRAVRDAARRGARGRRLAARPAARGGGQGPADPGPHWQGRQDARGRRPARRHQDLPGSRRRRGGARRVTALRSALFLAILIAFTPFYWVLVMLSAPFSRPARYRVIIGWNRFALWLIRNLLGIAHAVHGRENIPREPCVILSKHQSAWETIVYSAIFPPHVYVIKRELLWIPFLGGALGLMSPIAINRADRKRALQRLIEGGGERLAQGFSIMVYPEGTRVAVGRRGIYKLGGAVIAVNNRAQLLPVAHNADLVWPRTSVLTHPAKLTVSIGASLDTVGLPSEQRRRRTEDWSDGEMAPPTPPTAIAERAQPQATQGYGARVDG